MTAWGQNGQDTFPQIWETILPPPLKTLNATAETIQSVLALLPILPLKPLLLKAF